MILVRMEGSLSRRIVCRTLRFFGWGTMAILQVRLMMCWNEKRQTTSGEAEVRNSRPVLTQSLNY